MRLFARRRFDPRRLSTPIAVAELEVLADEALKTARAIKANVALLREQDLGELGPDASEGGEK